VAFLEDVALLPQERHLAAEPHELGLLLGRRALESPGINVRLAQPAPECVRVNTQIAGDLAGREFARPRELDSASAELRGICRSGWASNSHPMWPSSLLPSLAVVSVVR